MNGPSKFDELRLKTDRQLIQLANHELDLGMRDAQKALDSAGNWASAERHYLVAERAHAKATPLNGLASDTREDELRLLDSRLRLLREMLDALSAVGSTPREDEIAALARALWKARGCPEGLPEEDWFRAATGLEAAPCLRGELV